MAEEEEEGETERKGQSGKKKAASSSSKKKAAPSPRKSSRGAAADERKAAAHADEEDEEDGDAEDADAAAARHLDEEYSLPLMLASQSSSSSGAGGSISKEEAEKLLDAQALKQALPHKDELIKRLKKLGLVLGKLPQRAEVSPKMRALAAVLVDRQIIKNKSQEVRAISACCIADLFRLFAPSHPFGDEQLRLAFDLMTSLLSNLSAATHPDFNRYYMLLESMASVKFANTLCNRSTECDEIMRALFELFFALAKHDLSSALLNHFLVIMGDLAAHCDPLPGVLLDAVLLQLTPEQHEANPAGTKLAIQLINMFAHVFERPILTFLDETLVHPPAEGDDLATGLTEREQHLSILMFLFQHCSGVLVPFQRAAQSLLDSSLDEKQREEYTDLFCQVFESPKMSSGAPANAAQFDALFDMLLQRFIDVSPRVRVRISKEAGRLLIAHKDIEENANRLRACLQESLLDREESVRQSVVESLGEAGLADGELLTLDLVHEIGSRCKDKKINVRRAALDTLAHLFAAHCSRYWRVGQGAPLQTYRSIPKRLLLAAKLDLHTAVSVDVLLDEKALGSDVSVEERTRCLTGLYVSLANSAAKKAKPKAVAAADSSELTAEQTEEEKGAAAVAHEEQEARSAFEENILGMKVRLHRTVNHLLDLPSKLRTGALAQASFDAERHKSLATLAHELNVEHDTQTEEVLASLNVLFFESKDKNITKCLRALSNPLTGYEQIRLAQQGLPQAVKQMGASVLSKGKRGAGLVLLANRLATMLSLALLPMESIEVIYREMAASGQQPRREAYFKSLQELLLLVAAKFPALLTHPHTMRALLDHVKLGMTRERDEIVTNALRTLVALQDRAPLLADRALDTELLEQMQELALHSYAEHADLAVQIIQKLWSQQADDAELDGAAPATAGSKKSKTARPSADAVLSDLLRTHCAQNVSLESEHLETALACAARVAEVNYPVFLACTSEREQLLSFLYDELMPHRDIVTLVPARLAALTLVQHFLVAHGRSGKKILDSPGEAAKKGSDAAPLPASLPRNWVVLLLKVLKVDGRWPDTRMTTREQLQLATDEQETFEVQDARLNFLLHTGYVLLEICNVPVYHHFFLHIPAAASAAPAAASTEKASLLSPKQAPAPAPPVRHTFHLLPLLYLARHDVPQLAKAFIERVAKLLRTNRLSFPLFSSVLVMAHTHEDRQFVAKISAELTDLIRRQRMLAFAVQKRFEQHEQAKHAAAAGVAAASDDVSPSKGKKGRGGKKSGPTEDEEMEALEAKQSARIANSTFPEYALTDLLYVQSYDAWFTDKLPLKPSREEITALHQQYDAQLGFIEFFLEALLADTPEQGGRHFALLFSLLTRLRAFEDVRDPSNVKLYKLGELALRALQKVSSSTKWSTVNYEAQATLSTSLFRRRTTPHARSAYIPSDYSPHITLHKTKPAAAAAAGSGGSEPATPKRKRKSKATSSDAGSLGEEEDEDDEEEQRGGSAKKAKTSSGAKPRKSTTPKKAKAEATSTRTRLSRGAKEAVKYDVDREASDVDEDEDAYIVKPAATANGHSKPHSKAKAKAKAAHSSDEEDEDEAEEEAESDDDVDMMGSSAPHSKRRASATAAAAGGTSTPRKSKAAVSAASSDEEEAPKSARGSSKKKAPVSGGKQTSIKAHFK